MSKITFILNILELSGFLSDRLLTVKLNQLSRVRKFQNFVILTLDRIERRFNITPYQTKNGPNLTKILPTLVVY